MKSLELSVVNAMRDVDRAEWDALAAPLAAPRAPHGGGPFLSWGFLALLEESRSIRPETGWSPCHFLLRREGRLVAAAPFYGKVHSLGEFVFDFDFALLAQELGAAYYPKLVGMVPTTPIPAWRPLAAPGEDGAALQELVLGAAVRSARASGLAGVQLNWPAEDFRPPAEDRGTGASELFREWRHGAYLWEDSGYGDFQGYLASMTRNMRRNILRERRSVAAAGLETRIVGAEEAAADRHLLPLMADLYALTNDKFGPWGARFLERDFFLRLPEFMPQGWFLSAAFRGREPLALALLFEDGENLYGRYWGSSDFVEGLHFELCYYLPVEHALRTGKKRFDPGMGGEHKARRGFRSRTVPSYHLSFDRRIDRVFRLALPRANHAEEERAVELNRELPFKKKN